MYFKGITAQPPILIFFTSSMTAMPSYPLKIQRGGSLSAIIDTSGQILSQHPQYNYEENASGQSAGTEMFLTPVRDGHAVKQIKGENFFLCDVYGNVVCQSEGDDVWQIWGSDSDYILVRHYVETLEKSETVYGLLAFQGNWVVDINTNPIHELPLTTNTLVFSNAFAYAKALNEDIILIGGDFLSENDVLYRITTGQLFCKRVKEAKANGSYLVSTCGLYD